MHDRPRVSEAPRPRIDFQYGLPDVSHFPRTAWLRSLRRVMVQTPSDRFNYLGGRGTPELRRALADYLNRVRATVAHPENVVICNGFTEGLTLLCQVLPASGARRVAVEDPSDVGARTLIATAGLEVVPIPVDGAGLRVDILERRGADAVLVTAAHQCPTGVTLGAQSRSALIEWAARADALIIEDDYDAEYRYDRAPVGAIQGLGPEHVIYAGSASKTLAPGLRLGWMVVPSRLVDPIAAARHMADRGAPVLEQLALADFLSSGEFDRHLRRMRPIYRGRRDVLLAALARHLPGFRPSGVAAGLHVLTWLPAGLPEARVVEAATSQGVRVDPLAPYRIDDTGDGGVLFGYAGVPERLIAEGIESISQALA